MNILQFVFLTFYFLGFVNAQENKLIELNKQNLITMRGEIDEQLTSELVGKINKFNNNQVYLYITSPGGSVIEGLQIIDQLKTLEYRNIKLSCIADFAASMAFVIFQACPIRYITTSSILMQHQMSLKLKGNIENIYTYLNFIKDIDTDLDEMQSNKLNISLDEFRKKINNNWWMNYKSIIKNNAADSIVTVICTSELVDMLEEITKSTLLFDVKAKFSKCPISREPTQISYRAKVDGVYINEQLLNDIVNKITPSKFIFKLCINL